jgi:predicted DNA-binding transcriptional regulator AlpA
MELGQVSKVLLRFNDLKARNIVTNRVTLGEWIKRGAFPPGIQLAERTRAWSEDEIEAWLASRRVGPLPPIIARAAKVKMA